ncbi:MAG: histidine phosphatase family protein [Clostridia bacterium]|jgi:alpha-ribazole phosphatase|nr:histidine phosphatase family protein [Clostridia bacterium]
MKITFFRHGMTKGNEERRYVGKTDENLSGNGISLLKNIVRTGVDAVYSSPMKRCIQTAEILFPKKRINVCELIAECDFGCFEYKNYEELKNDDKYISWLKSNGKLGFPCGEDTNEFKKRCVEGFLNIAKDAYNKNYNKIAVVTHGGVIMSIFERFTDTDFYNWQLKNGEYITADFDYSEMILKNIER